MIAFKSCWRRQIRLVIIIPQRANVMIGRDIVWHVGDRIGVNRKRPYPPSFSSTAARIMEPAIGASTWAFGSQRCRL